MTRDEWWDYDVGMVLRALARGEITSRVARDWLERMIMVAEAR